MICSQTPPNAEGRWAIPQDKPFLQAYAAAYLAERRTGSLNHPWDDWIQKRSIAVLEHENQIVSVVRYITTRCDAIIIAPFTFSQFRKQGFARKLLAFLVGELLQVYPRMLHLVRSAGNQPYHHLGSPHLIRFWTARLLLTS
jgi:predicted GNAT family acetyltransferase